MNKLPKLLENLTNEIEPVELNVCYDYDDFDDCVVSVQRFAVAKTGNKLAGFIQLDLDNYNELFNSTNGFEDSVFIVTGVSKLGNVERWVNQIYDGVVFVEPVFFYSEALKKRVVRVMFTADKRGNILD